jgi:hypothetical protein
MFRKKEYVVTAIHEGIEKEIEYLKHFPGGDFISPYTLPTDIGRLDARQYNIELLQTKTTCIDFYVAQLHDRYLDMNAHIVTPAEYDLLRQNLGSTIHARGIGSVRNILRCLR